MFDSLETKLIKFPFCFPCVAPENIYLVLEILRDGVNKSLQMLH